MSSALVNHSPLAAPIDMQQPASSHSFPVVHRKVIVDRASMYRNTRTAYRMACSLITHSNRRLLNILLQYPDGLSVTELYCIAFKGVDTDYAQVMTSQTLRVLRQHRLVTTERKGKYMIYTARVSRIERINAALKNFFES